MTEKTARCIGWLQGFSSTVWALLSTNDGARLVSEEAAAEYDKVVAELADEVTVFHLTPEQAVEATLGRGTCKVEMHVTDGLTTDHPSNWNLLSCGHWVGMAEFDKPRYCPNCGRRVEP